MKAEREFDLIHFISFLEKKKIPYLLIGRWAVILHGAPLMTADYDFWVSPKSKKKLLELLVEAQNFEVPSRSEWDRPILSVYVGPEKIDFFFIGKLVNREGKSLIFKECWKRSVVKQDSGTGFKVRIPSVDDLINLKKIDRKNKQAAIKDSADIAFLLQVKKRERG